MLLPDNVLEDFKNQGIFLLADILVERRMSNMALNCALHHCASIIVFNVAFPSTFVQIVTICEALFAEILDCIIVGIGQKVVQIFGLGVVFELVHQARSVAFNLLLRCDRQEDNLCKLLFVKRSEDAAT